MCSRTKWTLTNIKGRLVGRISYVENVWKTKIQKEGRSRIEARLVEGRNESTSLKKRGKTLVVCIALE